jgi:hypothetical protein
MPASQDDWPTSERMPSYEADAAAFANAGLQGRNSYRGDDR